MNDLEKIIYKHALLNAAKHKGSANPGYEELRAGRARVGHAHRPGRGRRGRRRPRLRPGAGAALVGDRGRRGLDGALPERIAPPARVRRERPGGRLAVLRLAVGLGAAQAAGGDALAHAGLLAHPRLRGLLVLHARGRGRRRPGRKN